MTTPTQPADGIALPGIQRKGNLIYALNSDYTNRWYALVQPGRDDDDKRVSDEECEQVAAILADRATRAETAPVVQPVAAEPMFWVRLCGDGMYEGPEHHKSLAGKWFRDEKPDEWYPLYLGAAPAPIPEGCTPADARKLREDAERYRWLRNCANALRKEAPQVLITDCWGVPASPLAWAYPQGNDLDTAIDAARGVPAPTAGDAGGDAELTVVAAALKSAMARANRMGISSTDAICIITEYEAVSDAVRVTHQGTQQ